MPNLVKIVECPRDAWQGLPKTIPAEIKAEYLRLLVASGFKHIDAVSFVSPKAVPQMADSEQTLMYLDPPDDVEIIAIVVNKEGAERALATDAVSTLGFPYSVSPTFLERNQRQTPEQALEVLDAISELAYQSRTELVAYISMAFGNPYGDAWSAEEVREACLLLADSGVRQISLADTVGVAGADEIRALLEVVLPGLAAEDDAIELGVHLHSRREDVAAKTIAAYRAGCRRFDTAIAGMGGCPFAQDALVGNLATELALEALLEAGAELPPLRPLDGLIAASNGLAQKFGFAVQ